MPLRVSDTRLAQDHGMSSGRRPRPSCADWQHTRKEIAGCYLFDHARNFPARFDLNFPIGDRAGNMTTRADQQPFADHEFALETATHVSVFSRGMAVENTGLSDNHVLALLQFRFNRPVDDEAVAGGDLARKGNSLTNNQSSAINLITP